MITFDFTKGGTAKYEVIIVTRDLTIRILYHYYTDARERFSNTISKHIAGVNVWLNDLTA